MALLFPTMAERPDLRPRARELMAVWPQFMHHDPVCNRLFGRVRDEHAHLQFFAWDDELDEVVGEGMRFRRHGTTTPRSFQMEASTRSWKPPSPTSTRPRLSCPHYRSWSLRAIRGVA